jgi:hypothetical protein
MKPITLTSIDVSLRKHLSHACLIVSNYEKLTMSNFVAKRLLDTGAYRYIGTGTQIP